MAIIYAVLCLCFAAGNDLLFKFYARKQRSNGLFVFVVGIFWMLFAACLLKGWPEHWGPTVLWGIVSALMSVCGNLLMLKAMRTLDAGVCSTIYRLNMVPAVIGAALLLDESISIAGYCGIFLALLAVAGFMPGKEEGEKRKLAAVGLTLMISASVMRAVMGLSYRYGFLHGADRHWVVLIDSTAWIIGGLIYYYRLEPEFTKKKEPGTSVFLEKGLWGYGFFSGALVAGVTLTLAAALAYGKASVILPITQMSFVLTAIMGVLFLKEKMTIRKMLAILSGAAAVVVLSL